MQTHQTSSPAYTRLSQSWRSHVGKTGVIVELTTQEYQGITHSIALVRFDREVKLLPVALGYVFAPRDQVVVTLRRANSRSADLSNEIIPYRLAVKPMQNPLPLPKLEPEKQIQQERLVDQSEERKPKIQEHPAGRVRKRE